MITQTTVCVRSRGWLETRVARRLCRRLRPAAVRLHPLPLLRRQSRALRGVVLIPSLLDLGRELGPTRPGPAPPPATVCVPDSIHFFSSASRFSRVARSCSTRSLSCSSRFSRTDCTSYSSEDVVVMRYRARRFSCCSFQASVPTSSSSEPSSERFSDGAREGIGGSGGADAGVRQIRRLVRLFATGNFDVHHGNLGALLRRRLLHHVLRGGHHDLFLHDASSPLFGAGRPLPRLLKRIAPLVV